MVKPTAALFGRPTHDGLAALADACDAAGYRVRWQNPSVFRAADMIPAELVAVHGLHGGAGVARDVYAASGVPVLVLDLGFLRRDLGYWQLGWDGLNWLPPFPCPADRFAALDVKLETRGPGRHVLVLGQRPGDKSHAIEGHEYEAWVDHAIATITAHSDRPIQYRPHPKHPGMKKPAGTYEMTDPTLPLSAAFQKCHAVVCYNSTAGLQAIAAGLPVVCDPTAMYAEHCETDLTRIESVAPMGEDARADLLARVAYGQWRTREMRQALGFMLAARRGESPMMPAAKAPKVRRKAKR